MVAAHGQPPVWLLDEVDITATIRDFRIVRGDDGTARVELILAASLEVLMAGAAVELMVKVED